ncbi:Piso0_001330 [Millerozyma farinosa CBS 7064]|uniref:Piso0_001330 protein n=1 Tax=Pichia sorbitophila (strain ATCC MYA-4447 / BCRC 22081 / CBS 7064 / NBRC 10061 / NRRL Y-12695) TaxID=559304 RepID=G8YMG6_PICSO|nr:Piso0_001330 [Millerozyma farinosa CBS 7064]
MAKGGNSHRSTLKTIHKSFKSRFSSKNDLKNRNKGRIEKSSGKTGKGTEMSKIARKNLAKQLKANKIQSIKESRRLFEGSQGIEKIITVICLTDDISPSDIASKLISCVNDDGDHIMLDCPSVTSVKVNRFKSKLKIIIPDPNDVLSILDATKISDYVLIGLSATKEVDVDQGEMILRACISQGIASVIGVLPNIVSSYPKRNLQLDVRQSLQSYFQHFFPEEEKMFAIENSTECINCIRTISQKFPKSITWRDSRGYLVAEDIQLGMCERDSSDLLIVEGHVRGTGFSSNRLVHIPGFGDFQLEYIERIKEFKRSEGDNIEDQNIYTPDINQETLEELNPEEIDMDSDMDSYNEEYGVRMDGKTYFSNFEDDVTHSNKKKLPKGTSEYQSRWLLDDVLEGASDLESDDDSITEEVDMNEEEMNMEDGEASIENDMGEDDNSEMFLDLSPEEEARQLNEIRSQAREDLEFPDELELEPSDSAKEKLKSYRGVKSLGNSEWDSNEVDEETPDMWKRLLRVSNFRATKNKVAKDAIKDCKVVTGDKVKLGIRAPRSIIESQRASQVPLTVYSLLQHEHKLAAMNFSFEIMDNYEAPVATKESLIVQYGFRRQVINPIFSEFSNTPNNVHKLERFVHEGQTSVATCIAPVLFNNAPTIFFKQGTNGLALVGSGTVLNADSSRIIAERVTLTGYPVKIHKKVVTVRYMFFNPDDINWFKAVPLFTKSGRTGFIKESLGTHGYFKAIFDGKITSQDTVAMSMYKRSWPETSQLYFN